MSVRVIKERSTNNKVNLRKDNLTTTELAKLCGVSRFTIINWINQGKIRTRKTAGGHFRIPVSEAISFYETLHKEKTGTTSESLYHCWEYQQKTNCDKECKNCLVYKGRIDYCFVVVHKFGKKLIRCKGECSSCDYFEEFFGSYINKAPLCDIHEIKGVKAAKDKKHILSNVAYGLGRGTREIKGKVTGIKEMFGAKRSRVKKDGR